MMHTIRLAVAAGLLVLTVAPRGAAAASEPEITLDPNGVYHIDFVTPGVFDFSKSTTSVSPQGISHYEVLVHSARGRLAGEFRDWDDAGFDVGGFMKGVCRTSRGVTVMGLKQSAWGTTGSGEGDFKAKGVVRGQVYGFGSFATLVTTTESKVCQKVTDPIKNRSKVFCNTQTIDHTLNLANAGDWRISIALERSDTRLYGAASISTGAKIPAKTRTFDVSVAGKIGRDGIATIKLTPMDDDGLGSVRLEATVVGGDDVESPTIVAVHEVKGKLLGQAFNEAY